MHDLLSIEAADHLIRTTLEPFGSEAVPILNAAGRILRQDVKAERALPPYDRVILDGIAVRWHEGVTAFRPIATQPAGQPPLALPHHHGSAGETLSPAIAVMTGSVVPSGADTIVPREAYELRGDGNAATIHLRPEARPVRGQHIHLRGADCAAGAVLLDAGIRLTPPDLAILAANGVARPELAIVPAIAIVSNGDELVSPDAPVQGWQIRRSNEYALSASLGRQGFTRQSLSVVPDDLAAVRTHLHALLETHDVLVISGGVSMGEFDFIPRALAELDVRTVIHKVAQRPGKPFWFGLSGKGQPVFALPGNPVSALACCSRHVVPALLRAQGYRPVPRMVALGDDVSPLRSATRLVPVRLQGDSTGQIRAMPHPMPTSGDFNRLGTTDGIVSLSPGEAPYRAGQVVAFHEW